MGVQSAGLYTFFLELWWMLGIRVPQYPQGCHLVLFFDLTRTSKYHKAPSCEFGSDSAGSADPLGIWEGFAAEVP